MSTLTNAWQVNFDSGLHNLIMQMQKKKMQKLNTHCHIKMDQPLTIKKYQKIIYVHILLLFLF